MADQPWTPTNRGLNGPRPSPTRSANGKPGQGSRFYEINTNWSPTIEGQTDLQKSVFDYYDKHGGDTAATDGPGPGGGGRGPGGGGTPYRPLSQEAFNRMLGLVNAERPTYNPTQYEGMPMRPFDDSLYRDARRAINRGYRQAGRQVGDATDYARGALDRNWGNHNVMMDMIPQTSTPEMPARVSTLAENPWAVDEGRRNAAASDRAFQNYMQAHNARASQGQASRQHELELANNYALQQLQQGKLADRTGVDIARTRAFQDWQRAADERDYQDNLLGQTWGRDDGRFAFENESRLLNEKIAALLGLIPAADQAGLDLSGMVI